MRQWMETLQRLTHRQRSSRLNMFKVIRSVDVRVVEAKELSRSGDYYCMVLLDDEQQVGVCCELQPFLRDLRCVLCNPIKTFQGYIIAHSKKK